MKTILTEANCSDELKHFGVKGMKWGVRKEREKKAGRRKSLTSVDPSIAKNKQTKRVAEDYNKLTDSEFKNKYYTSKETFAKRYSKTNGNTYSLGKKRQKMANAVLKGGKALGKAAYTAANVATLGAAGRIRKAEKAHAEYRKDYKPTLVGTGVRTYLRYKGRQGRHYMNKLATMGLATAASAIAIKSGMNPSVVRGAKIVGKTWHTMSTLSMAALDAYDAYATARDIGETAVNMAKKASNR